MPVLPGYAGASKPWTNSDVHPPHVCVNPLVHRALCPGRETSIYLPGAWNHHYTLTFRKLLIHPPYPSHTPSYNAGDIAGTAVLKQWWCRLMTKLSARFPVSGFFVLAVASSSSAASSYCSSCSISTPRPANQSSSANRGEREPTYICEPNCLSCEFSAVFITYHQHGLWTSSCSLLFCLC